MEFPQKSQWLSIKVFCIWRLTYLYFYLPLCMKALYSSKSGLFPTPWALHGFSRLLHLFYLLSLYGMAVILQIVVILVKEGPFQILHLLVKTFSCTFLFETVKYFLFLLLAASCYVPFLPSWTGHQDWVWIFCFFIFSALNIMLLNYILK